MRLTRFSDIGLRVLLYLAPAGERQVTVTEIAQQFDIPVNHLTKVISHLVRNGWVETTRGRNGGLRLCADASTLTIGTVLRELEGSAELADCEGLDCSLRQHCKLRYALKKGLLAFYGVMDAYTLFDVSVGKTGEQIVHMHRSFLGQSLHADSLQNFSVEPVHN
jgi:Rrf2 family nitric oxide-sensitive transcriptional repressor